MSRPRVMNGPRGGRQQIVDKPQNLKKSTMQLINYSNKYLPLIIIALIAASLSAILQIIGPDQIKKVTNLIGAGLPVVVDGASINNSIDMKAVANIMILLIAFYTLSTILHISQNKIMASVTHRISQKLRTDIASKINKVPLKYFDSTSVGDVLSRISNDVDIIGQTLNQSIATLISAIIMFLGSLIMMFITNWIMAIAAVSASFIGFVLMIIIMSKSQKHFVAQQMGLGAINGYIEEMYSGHNVVKAYNASPQVLTNFQHINNKLYANEWKAQFLSGLMIPLMHFIGNFGYVVVCIVGAILADKNQISFGVIVAFMLYVRLFTNPLSQMAQAFNNLQMTAAASERVFSFLNEPELADESAQAALIKKAAGNIVFDHVCFGYNADKKVINNFSVTIKAGDKVAIVGPTGAGKTTLVNLLMRFYQVDSGQILIDNININDTTREDVHNQFCMVLQDTWLFEATIAENIIYSKEGVTNQQVEEACKQVGLHHFITSLPQRYQTILNENSSISEGQKQLITIARAMIKNAPLLILDEATSSVDTRSEVIIQEAMDKLMKGRTSFIIAHRLSTIKNADIILVINDGDIVEKGNHQQLLAANGFYAKLYNSQFETN